MDLKANMKTHKNVKCDVTIENVRTRLFHISVSDVYFTNFTHKVAYKLKKN